MSVRVLLVDDHTLFRKGLAELLEATRKSMSPASLAAQKRRAGCWRN